MRLTQTIIFMLLLSLAVFGQTNRGAISGTVTDSTGAAIPGAKVTVTNLGTNQSITINTSDDGAFSATSLEPVKYSVLVEAANFKTSVIPEVKVDTATTQTVNVVMDAGNITEKVTITADAPLLNTESGTTGKTITERQLEDVPLSNRSVLDLATTVPNVSGEVGSEDPDVTSGVPAPGFNLSINGGRAGSTAILADGTNNTGVGIARQVVSLTPETVQEFTVQTSAFSAEYGNTTGGVINATTKSGTNRLTGTALWYHRNPQTNARKWTNGAVRPPNNLRINQVSFAVGGPVFLPAFGEGNSPIYNGKDRTFFFFAVEPRWRKDFVVTDTLLPTLAERQGDFRGLVRTNSGWIPTSVAAQFAGVSNNVASIGQSNIYNQYVLVGNQLQRLANPTGTNRYCQFGETSTVAGGYCSTATPTNDALNVIPKNFLDPVALKALQFMPEPGGYFLNGDGFVRNYIVNRFVVQNEVRYTGRFDHNFTKNNRANMRFTVVPAVGSKGFGSDVNGNGASYSNSKQYVATDSHIFSSSFINELRAGYTTGTFSDDFTPEFSIIGGRNLATELGLPSTTEGGMPLLTFTDGYNAFANIGSSGSTNNFNTEKRYTLTDILYWNQGNKTWKFGVDYSDAYLNVIPFFAASGGSFAFRTGNTALNQTTSATQGGDSFASFLLGVANNVNIRALLIPYNYNWKSYAGFVQNDWKVKPNLTLNLGMRYSLALPRTEENNLQGTYDLSLAKDFPLTTTTGAPTSITLPTGRVVTSALVPPFAYSGRGGRSRYLYPIDWNGWEPRFGFAWSPKGLFGWNLEGTTVVRGGYGLSHAPLTGNNRLPLPDLGAANANSATTVGTTAANPISSTGTANSAFVLRLSSNPPLVGRTLLNATPAEIEQTLGIPSDGLVYLGSLAIPAYSITGKPRTPFVQNWNLTVSHQVMRNTVLEVAYVGNKGSHLFLPFVNVNPRDFDYIEQIELANVNSDSTVADPLRRQSLIGGNLSVTNASLGSKYLGFDTLNSFYDTSGSSIRHAVYVDLRRRITNGIAFTANYTFGKSMDNASDASPDKNVLSAGNTAGSNFSFGAPLSSDYSISTYDVKHVFSSTFIWDLPFGKKRQFFKDAWAPLDAVIGGWTMSGVFKMSSGYPYLPTISEGNRLSTNLTHSIRPDIVSGVPLVNPRYSSTCKASTICEPYINPAAFMRPAKGSLGNSARTLDIRGPFLKFFDVSFQKNFNLPFGLSNDGKRKVQLRVDLINAFNLPNFRIGSTSSGSGAFDFMGLPTDAAITLAEYNTWAAANGKPQVTSTTDPALVQVQNLTISNRGSSGVLPLNFYNIPLPEGFATTSANSFDITTLQGYKLYRLRNAYNTGFGQLRELGQPRYVQFGLKIYF